MTERSVLAKRECACHAARGLVEFCPLHKAAQAMLEALEKVADVDLDYSLAALRTIAARAIRAATAAR